MKKFITLTAAILLIVFSINSQEKKEKESENKMFSTEQMAKLQSKKMVLEFDLDKSQQDAIFKLIQTQADERAKAKEKFKKNKKEGVKLTNEERFQIANTKLDKQIQHKASMKRILSNEQYEKWEKVNKAKRQNTGMQRRSPQKMRQQRSGYQQKQRTGAKGQSRDHQKSGKRGHESSGHKKNN